MAIYRLKIVGVHYAVNPDSDSSTEETELMHQRTAQRLRELDEQRPRVVLVPEPTNPADARAVMARVMGKRIGYVDRTQLGIAHSLLQASGGRPLIASIVEVEARKHGWLFAALETDGEMPVEPLQKAEDAWKQWTSTMPVIAPDEAYFAREEAEVMLDDVLSKYPTMHVPSGVAPQSTQSSTESLSLPSDDASATIVTQSEAKDDMNGGMDDIDNAEEKFSETPCKSVVKHTPAIDIDLLEEYIRLWLRSALHDLSNEARLTREHYIMRLKQMMSRNVTPLPEPLPRIEGLVTELEKQRTAICGQKRSTLRADKWWKELMQSEEMNRLWKTWKARYSDDTELGTSELDASLRTLPYDLYAYIDDRKLFFSRLHYSHVPRTQYWQILSLMLLRERLQKELAGGYETYHPWENESFPQVEEGRRNRQLHRPDGRWGYETYPHPGKEESKFEVTIPKEFQSPEAKKILAKLQKKGLLDADFQPSTLVGWEKGVLAYELTERLEIAKRWVVMATLWKCSASTLRQNYSKNFNEDKAIEFSKKVKAMIYSV